MRDLAHRVGVYFGVADPTSEELAQVRTPPPSRSRRIFAATVGALAFGFLMEGFGRATGDHRFSVGDALVTAAIFGVLSAAVRYFVERHDRHQ